MVFVSYKNINRWNNPKNMLFCVEKYNARNFMGKNFLGDKLKYIHVPVYFINLLFVSNFFPNQTFKKFI